MPWARLRDQSNGEYLPEKLQLVPGSPVGDSSDAIEVGDNLKPNFNPGNVTLKIPLLEGPRKPLIAGWQFSNGNELYTINFHLTSKGGSSSIEGDTRLPINLLIDHRTRQVVVVVYFVKSILSQNSEAKVIVVGDFNSARSTLLS